MKEGKFTFLFQSQGKKNEHLIEQFYSIRLIEFSFLIKVLLYQYLQEEIIGMVKSTQLCPNNY